MRNSRRPWSRGARARRVAAGITLIEMLVTVSIIAIVMAATLMGSGAVANSQLRGGAAMIAGAVRVAYTRASATSRTNRVVFDLDNRRVWLEETEDSIAVKTGDTTGGAEAVTEAEKAASDEASRIIKGPQIARARFRAVRALGFEEDERDKGRALGARIRFGTVFTGHTPDGQKEGRAYLYFWPGGQTERAAVQLVRPGEPPSDGLTILVSPMTGRAKTVQGAAELEPLRDDGTNTEREDNGF